MRFSEYAASLFERKVLKGEISSAQTRENWELMLRLHLFPAFGDVFVDAISKGDVEAWLADEAKKVKAEKYSPVTVNNWLRFFRGIMNEAVDEFGLAKNPVMKVKGLNTGAHVSYTEEEPNALLPEEVGPFLAAMRDRQPQHLGMVALGFATGWRPSMMRPLRRKGPSADVLWDSNVVLARRSQTRGDEVREATKNATRFRVTLPPDVMAILRWHTEHLPAGPMQGSDLLFPSDTGGFRSTTVLDKPFKDVCKHLALGKKVTPKAMRRTFQDLARLAALDGLVQRSICGHLTEEMTERYSSVAQAEVEAALGKVVSLAGYRDLLRTAGGGKKRSGGKVVGKPITTPTTASASPSQVLVTN
jgi:integrase